MNRKSFLKTLFTGLVATKLALSLGAESAPELPETDIPKPVKWVVNPAWVKAEYEIEVYGDSCVMARTGKQQPDPFPLRFKLVEGEWVQIQAFIQQ